VVEVGIGVRAEIGIGVSFEIMVGGRIGIGVGIGVRIEIMVKVEVRVVGVGEVVVKGRVAFALNLKTMLNKIKEHCKAVKELIDKPIDPENRDELVGKLNDLIAISGLSASNMANAKLEWRKAQEVIIEGLMTDPVNLSASLTNDYVKSRCGMYEAAHEMADRLDKKLGGAIEGLRTLISLHKTEIENSLK